MNDHNSQQSFHHWGIGAAWEIELRWRWGGRTPSAIYSSRPSIPGWLTRPDRGGEKVQRVPELDWRVKCRKQRPADNRNRSRNPSPNACIAIVAQEGDIAWVMSFTRLPFGFVVPEQAEGKKNRKKKTVEGLRKSLVKIMNGSREMINLWLCR